MSSLKDNDILEELKPPSNLQSLELHGYNSKICCPGWWTSDLLHLSDVTMEDFPRCTSLPLLGLLPNLKLLVLRKMASITRIEASELRVGNREAFRQLSKFTVDDMPSLKDFNSGDGECKFQVFDKLVVQKCPNLRFGPFPPRANRMMISECNPEMTSWHNKRVAVEEPSCSSAPVDELVIERCQEPLREWRLLHQLQGVRSLIIKECKNISSSEEKEITQSLSTLHSLCFSRCKHMATLPEYLGDLASLHHLKIERCRRLNTLTDTMEHLTSLESIEIINCKRIRKLPEWLGSLKSLQKLSISGCNSICALPQSIDKLTNLKHLNIISRNPELKSWLQTVENKKWMADVQLTHKYVPHCFYISYPLITVHLYLFFCL